MFEVNGEPCISCQADGTWTIGGTCAQGTCIVLTVYIVFVSPAFSMAEI